MKRILFVGDQQCGHMSGLTHPSYWIPESRNKELGADWRGVQKKGWEFFFENTRRKKYDGLILMGDGIDGKQIKSGSRELITADRIEQCKMLRRTIDHIKTDKIAMVYGTGYHVGNFDRWEKTIAESIGADIKDIQEIKLYDKILRARHHIGRSSTPVGGDIALRKFMVNEMLWERDHDIPPADMYVFAHAHYFRRLLDASWDVWINPPLQMWTEFGANRCSGVIHFGFTELEIYPDGKHNVTPYLMRLKTAKLNPIMEW